MKLTPHQLQQLDEALRQVYQSREQLPIDLDAHWHADVMRSIRLLEPAGRNPLALFDVVVWKFAAVAGAFVMALSLCASVMGWNPLSDLADDFFSNPVQFAIVQSVREVLNL